MRMGYILFGLLSAICVPALAHHGWNEYDQTNPVTLQGTIVASGYEHPHGYVDLKADGKTWRVVLAPPSRMENRGLPPEAIKPGTAASVEGYRNRDKPDELRAERITVNGKTTELR
jgi:hypothetical protein